MLTYKENLIIVQFCETQPPLILKVWYLRLQNHVTISKDRFFSSPLSFKFEQNDSNKKLVFDEESLQNNAWKFIKWGSVHRNKLLKIPNTVPYKISIAK